VNSDNPEDKNPRVSSRPWLFVLARVYLGISFLFSDHGNAQPNELAGFLRFALKNGYRWYQNLLMSVVVPHSSTFGTLIVIAEIYVGIALVIGFTTRLASCVALFLLLNYMCAKGGSAVGPGHRSIGYHPGSYHPIQRCRPHIWYRQIVSQSISKTLDLVNRSNRLI